MNPLSSWKSPDIENETLNTIALINGIDLSVNTKYTKCCWVLCVSISSKLKDWNYVENLISSNYLDVQCKYVRIFCFYYVQCWELDQLNKYTYTNEKQDRVATDRMDLWNCTPTNILQRLRCPPFWYGKIHELRAWHASFANFVHFHVRASSFIPDSGERSRDKPD